MHSYIYVFLSVGAQNIRSVINIKDNARVGGNVAMQMNC